MSTRDVLAAAAALLAGIVLVPGCTGSGGSPTAGTTGSTTNPFTTPTGTEPTAPAAPQAATALAFFVEAAGRGDAAAMWELLSTPTRHRLGGDLETFRARYAPTFEAGAGSFASGDYRILLALQPDPRWAVAALVGSREADGVRQAGAYAAALRNEGGSWRLEIEGPVRLLPLVPAKGLRAGTSPQLGMRVQARRAIEEAALWVDGEPLPALAVGPDARRLLVAGKPITPLAPGAHAVVGYARAGPEATALAWVVRAK